MAKLKTNKATSKRFKITGKKKLLIRHGGQDHFNSRQSGKLTTRKRRDQQVSKSEHKAIKKVIHI
ncbi:50S ribosomal protein L35 [Patescibacteria group bacterium]